MKYMGSKRALLDNGLGLSLRRALSDQTTRYDSKARFVDMFTGSGSVAAYTAQHVRISTLATDLQLFCVILAGAVIERVQPLDATRVWARWSLRASDWLDAHHGYRATLSEFEVLGSRGADLTADAAKKWAHAQSESLVQAYVGHYFSPLQGLEIVALRETLPRTGPERTACLASLISAASVCAASPGHTAEPFRPGGSGGKHVIAAWRKSVLEQTFIALNRMARRYAMRLGSTAVRDAQNVAAELKNSDFVFIDPPYSAVQYSRFYHVLEAIALGSVGAVRGRGRYPDLSARPQSKFSNTTTATVAMTSLLKEVAARGARAMVTFPAGRASNGLTGSALRDIASEYFHVSDSAFAGSFSTMGGKPSRLVTKPGPRLPGHRPARQVSHELVLLLRPR